MSGLGKDDNVLDAMPRSPMGGEREGLPRPKRHWPASMDWEPYAEGLEERVEEMRVRITELEAALQKLDGEFESRGISVTVWPRTVIRGALSTSREEPHGD